MKFQTAVLWTLSFLTFFSIAADAQNVFVMPGSGGGQTVSVIQADPTAGVGTITASPSSFLVLTNPAAAKYYIISKATTDSIIVTDNVFHVQRRFNLPAAAQAAALTSDGRRLFVVADTLHVYDTVNNDNEISPSPALDVGLNPTDIAVSIDGSRVFVLSPTSGRLTGVDVSSLTVAASTVTVPGSATGVARGPNDLIYVTAPFSVYEIDGRTMTVRGNAISVNAFPGKATFTPDGTHALFVNQQPSTGSLLEFLDLTTHVSSRFSSSTLPGLTFDRVVLVGNNRAFAISVQGRLLYDVSLNPFTASVASYGSIGTLSGVSDIQASSDIPTAVTNSRFLFVATAATLNRIDLSLSQISGQVPLANPPGALSVAGPALRGTPAYVYQYNNNQTVNASGLSLPLVVRVLDANGRPVLNTPVSYSTSTSGVSIQGASTTTSAEGLAETSILAPSTNGSFTVTCTIGTGGVLSVSFTVNVGSVSVGTAATIELTSGNGQLATEGQAAGFPFVATLRDSNGVAVPNVPVTWGVVGPGQVSTVTLTSDNGGQASATFLSSLLPPGIVYLTSTVTVTAGILSKSFTVTTVSSAAVNAPTVQILSPGQSNFTLTGSAGQTIPAAVQVKVVAGGVALPNIGLAVFTGIDQTKDVYARCTVEGGTVLTDSTGSASCDLKLGGRIGTSSASIRVGGGAFGTSIQLTVNPGQPGVVRIIQGNGQAGNPGQRLSLALVAEIDDSFGNVLTGTQVSWDVSPAGGATLSNVVITADFNGRVSALPTLGTTTGSVQVRVRAGSAVGTFTLTVNAIVGTVTKALGDNQSAVVNQAFAQALIVFVTDTQGNPAPGVQVTFTVASGAATVSSSSATTDGTGKASVTASAGGSAGLVLINGTVGNTVVTFSLTVRLPGPVFAASGFFSAAVFQPGVNPSGLPSGGVAQGAIVTITGTGIATAAQGAVFANPLLGPLPTTLASVQVSFGGTLAPIYNVSNINGVESVTVQVPFETALGPLQVTITAGGVASTGVQVQVAPFSPGLLEAPMSDGRRRGVLVHADGTFVSLEKPAQKGETVRMFVIGLGQVSPAIGTNQLGAPGTVSSVVAPVVVGVNNAGVNPISAVYSSNLIGVYEVTFVVPNDTPSGGSIPLAIAVIQSDGSLAFGNGSSIPIL